MSNETKLQMRDICNTSSVVKISSFFESIILEEPE